MKLFAGTASTVLGTLIGKELNLPVFPFDQHIFPDGERRVRISEKIVSESVILVQSACPPVDTNYMELFLSLDALKRSGAEFIKAVVPYFGYQRQDHIFRDGEAVSLEVVIRILENLGIDELVSVDMHSSRIPDLFHIPVKHVSALPLFAEKIRSLFTTPEVIDSDTSGVNLLDMEGTILVSPDTGGIARIEKLSQFLDNMPFVALEKNRDLVTGDITIDAIKDGSIKNKKRAILVDDMISSGKTITLGAQFLKKQGIENIVVFATHPIFSQDAPKLLQESVIDKIFVTNTVVVPKEKQFKKLEILSVVPLLVRAIQS